MAVALAAAAPAGAATERLLVSSADALKYCHAGKLPTGSVDYINGKGGQAQFGPGLKCKQAVPALAVKKALVYKGGNVAHCALADATTALAFCNSGAMGIYNIDYINGRPGRTISGPGYGCVVNFSTSGIGGALCR